MNIVGKFNYENKTIDMLLQLLDTDWLNILSLERRIQDMCNDFDNPIGINTYKVLINSLFEHLKHYGTLLDTTTRLVNSLAIKEWHIKVGIRRKLNGEHCLVVLKK